MAVLLVYVFHLDSKPCYLLSLSLVLKTFKMFVFCDATRLIQDLLVEHPQFARHSSR